MPADLPAPKHLRPESRKEFQQAYEDEQEQQNQLANRGREDEEVETQSPEDQNKGRIAEFLFFFSPTQCTSSF